MQYWELKQALLKYFQGEAAQQVTLLKTLTCSHGKLAEYNAAFNKLAPACRGTLTDYSIKD